MLGNFLTKMIISSMLAVFLLNGCGEPKNLVERNGVWYEVNSQEPYTGDYTLTKSAEVNGEEKQWTAEEGYIRNGKFDGDFTFMGLDGSKATSTFKNGVQNGIYKEFSNNGQLIEESSYVDGKRNGKSKAFWANGQKKYDCEYHNGQIKSTCIEYNENGLDIKKSEIIGKNILKVTEATGQSSYTIHEKSIINDNMLYSADFISQCKVEEVFYNPKTGGIDVEMKLYEFTGEEPHITSTYYREDKNAPIEMEISEPGKCITKPAKSRAEAEKIYEKKWSY